MVSQVDALLVPGWQESSTWSECKVVWRVVVADMVARNLGRVINAKTALQPEQVAFFRQTQEEFVVGEAALTRLRATCVSRWFACESDRRSNTAMHAVGSERMVPVGNTEASSSF